MANFAAQEDTLLAGVAQTFNFKQKLGVNATSLVYSNDDASSTHTLKLDAMTFTVKPGEERVLSGVENWEVLTIGGNAGSTGAYRCYATSSDVPATIIKPQGGPITTSALADASVTDAKLAKGVHVASGTTVSGAPSPYSLMIIDLADVGAPTSVTYTGLIGKHELIGGYMLFDGTPSANNTIVEVQTAAAANILTITAKASTAGLVSFPEKSTVANSTLANNASFIVKTTKGGGNVNGRLVLFMLPVA